MNYFDYTGKIALITGASSGIGRVFAQQLAARGASLVLTARSGEKLRLLAAETEKKYGASAIIIEQDLAASDAVASIRDTLNTLEITPDILINSAGFASYGMFDTLSLERECAEITVNCIAPVELTHMVLPAMLEKGSGVIVNVASTAAMQPDPYMAVYGATKSFLLSFSEALWAEYRPRGIRILALCPGATETPFFNTVNAKEASVGKRMSAEDVVSQALKAVDTNRNYRITGCKNWLLGQLQRVLTRRRTLLIAEKILRPRQAK